MKKKLFVTSNEIILERYKTSSHKTGNRCQIYSVNKKKYQNKVKSKDNSDEVLSHFEGINNLVSVLCLQFSQNIF